mmetsp:Transcript_25194/g.64876  ORF Transcript_25194/g.64876 Transcript_25194/m.64876 type:complete len:451 (-) Transcript_25194:341-1693(-)
MAEKGGGAWEVPVPEWGSSSEDEEVSFVACDGERLVHEEEDGTEAAVTLTALGVAIEGAVSEGVELSQAAVAAEAIVRSASWNRPGNPPSWAPGRTVALQEGGPHPAALRLCMVAAVHAAGAEDQEAAEAELVRALREALRAAELLAVDSVAVEVVATAGCPLPLLPAPTPLGADDWAPSTAHRLADAFRAAGLLISGDTPVLTPSQLDGARAEVGAAVAQFDGAAAAAGLSVGGDADWRFAEVGGRGRSRFDLRLDVLGCAGTFPVLAALAADGPWRPAVNAILLDSSAPRVMSSSQRRELACDVSVVVSRPGADPQQWHADGPHLGGRSAGWWWECEREGQGEGGGGSVAPPYGRCVFVPLVAVDAAVGPTELWPGSHRWEGLVGLGHAATVLGATFSATMPAGGALLYGEKPSCRTCLFPLPFRFLVLPPTWCHTGAQMSQASVITH